MAPGRRAGDDAAAGGDDAAAGGDETSALSRRGGRATLTLRCRHHRGQRQGKGPTARKEGFHGTQAVPADRVGRRGGRRRGERHRHQRGERHRHRRARRRGPGAGAPGTVGPARGGHRHGEDRARPERVDGVGPRRGDRQEGHRGQPRQSGGRHRHRREHDVVGHRKRRPRRLPRVLAVEPQRRRADVPRQRHRGERRQARHHRADRVVRARLRHPGAPRAGHVGGVQGSRDRQAVLQPRDGRPRSLSRHRPELLAGRRDDHQEPRPALPGRVLRVGASDVRRPRQRRVGPRADPALLVDTDRRLGQVQARARRSCPRTTPTTGPIPTPSLPTTPRTCS